MNIKSKRASDFETLFNDTDSIGHENPYADSSDKEPQASAPPISFSPTSDRVELPAYSREAKNDSISCDKRTKWIAIALAIVAVCVLIIVLGCVYMIHVHPTIYPKKEIPDVCERVTCQNGGTCIDGKNNFNCLCARGFSGKLCEININDCDSSPCKNGATCKDALNSFTCTCKPGFTGFFCEEDINECNSQPCINEGVCHNEENGFSCRCLEGYAGPICESDINECASNPCINGGTCHDDINEYKCQCIMGYTGTHCEQDFNECGSSPCTNGSTCHDLTNGYKCQCPDGVTGTHCDQDIDECWSNPCVNGGTCHDDRSSYKCICPSGFTGFHCQSDINECLSNPCTNGATCHNWEDSHYCQCQSGYTGRYCETDIDECDSDPCENNGTCVDRVDGFMCICDPQSTGDRCESGVNPLGRCPSGFISYRPEGRCYFIEESSYRELTWSQAEEVCVSKGATLASFETAAELDFVASHFTWEGRYHIVSAMRRSDNILYWNTGSVLSNNDPSWNSGEPSSSKDCVAVIMRNQVSKFYSLDCYLARPYVCERSIVFVAGINDCRSLPCLNGATCHNLTNSFRCDCAPGFSGTFCEIDIDDCASTPCLNGADCIPGRGSYTCRCASGFSGANCETNINECASSPCYNGASCIDGINNFTCVCPTNFTGLLCRSGVNDRCLFGYVFYSRTVKCYYLQEDSNQQLTKSNAEIDCQQKGGSLASLENPDEANFVGAHFTWQGRYHTLGAERTGGQLYWYSGERLLNNHPNWASGNPYSSNDCVAATMNNNVTEFHSVDCYYSRPYVCEMAIRYPPGTTDCGSMPCLNGATCTNVNSTYTCECEPGYTGDNCETDIDECASSPCMHYGTCTNERGRFTCSCVPGYTGVMCETDIDECASDPCNNGSTCVEAFNAFSCICPANFTGRTCSADLHAECPPDFIHDVDNARCYFLEESSSEQRSYTSAKNFCQTKGANLASLETYEELQFVGSRFTWTGRYHVVGARREAYQFRWDSGAVLESTAQGWSSGEPGSYDDCVSVIKGSSDGVARLYSLSCSLSRPFVCEKEAT